MDVYVSLHLCLPLGLCFFLSVSPFLLFLSLSSLLMLPSFSLLHCQGFFLSLCIRIIILDLIFLLGWEHFSWQLEKKDDSLHWERPCQVRGHYWSSQRWASIID